MDSSSFVSIINSIITIILFGALPLFAFIMLANPLGINKKGNLYFGGFLFIWPTFWIEEIAEFSGIAPIHVPTLTFIHSIQILAPLLLYFSIVFYSNPTYKYSKSDIKHMIIPALYWIAQYYSITVLSSNTVLFGVIVTLMIIQSLLYSLLSFFKIRNHRKKLLMFASSTMGVNLDWLEYILIQILITTVVVAIHNIFIDSYEPGIIINGINLITVFIVAYNAFKQKEIYPGKAEQKENLAKLKTEPAITQTKRKVVSDKDLHLLKSKLSTLMKDKEPFLDSELNLIKLSEMLNISSHQLSYVINTGFDLNFFQYVNQFRVEKAKEMIKEGDEKYTILAIAYESGFNSKTSFNTTFKRFTELTPSEYKNTLTE